MNLFNLWKRQFFYLAIFLITTFLFQPAIMIYAEEQGGADIQNTNISGVSAENIEIIYEDSECPEKKGSITICKVIIDEDDNIINGSSAEDTEFEVDLFSVKNPTEKVGTALFNTPLNFNTSLFDSEIGNARCIVFENLEIDEYGYYWKEEVVSSSYEWSEPKYNDQFETIVNSLDDFYLYSGELFDTDPSNDEERNKDADGHIILSNDRADRTLVVLNQLIEPGINIVVNKIICKDESYLPNWGTERADGNPITHNIAQDFVLNSEGNCWFLEGWNFQWALNGTQNPGDNTGEAGLPWKTFGPTNLEGTATTFIPLSEAGSQVWVREVFQEDYIPFSGLDGTDVSAEFYCHTDVLNYDNYEWINGLENNETYYCVAFNVLKDSEEEEEDDNGQGSGGGGTFSYVEEGEVLGEEISEEELVCGLYLFEYIKYGAQNNPDEVIKLQLFLNEYMGANLLVNGIYDLETREWVNKFQLKHKEVILRPWVEEGMHSNENIPTGYVYKTTKQTINKIKCPSLILADINFDEDKRILASMGSVSGQVLGEETNVEGLENENLENEDLEDFEENLPEEENPPITEKQKTVAAPIIAGLLAIGLATFYLVKRRTK